MSTPITMNEFEQAGRKTVAFSGDLILANLGELPNRLENYSGSVDVIDVSKVGRYDTIGIWVVNSFAVSNKAKIVGMTEDGQALAKDVIDSHKPVKVHADRPNAIIQTLDRVGGGVLKGWETAKGLTAFLGAIAESIVAVVRDPHKFRQNAVTAQFEQVGIASLGIIGLMSFLIGVVIAQQGSVQLARFGAQIFTVDLVGRLTIRELGILMTAIMVAGRSGSAFAAQIGTMKLNDEVAAMGTMGISPIDALVLPRVLATVVMMPLLGFYAMIIALAGGGLMCWIGLDIPPDAFISRLKQVVPFTDLLVGTLKAPVFGLIIATAGCFQGMQVEGNAAEVGSHTTSAVVQSIFIVIVLDAFFAIFFTAIGWV